MCHDGGTEGSSEAISELLPPSTKSRETDAAWDWGTDLTDGLRLTHWTAYGLLLLLAVGLIFSAAAAAAAAAAACAGFSLNVLEPPRCFSFPWKCGKVNIGLRAEFASFSARILDGSELFPSLLAQYVALFV